MAHFHLHGRMTKRSQGQSAVAAAAYRSGEKFYDQRLDETFDYSKKSDVIHSEIITPEHAGEWATDREALWNNVHNKERQFSNAQLSREIEVGLQREFSFDENIDLIRRYAQSNFVDKGMIADINIHEPIASDGEKNPHAHIMLTLKPIDKETGDFASAKNRNWNSKEMFESFRESWEEMNNVLFEAKGLEERISRHTLAEQGIETTPQIHVGFASNDINTKEGYAERFERNEAIKESNKLVILANKAKEILQQQYQKAVAWVMRNDENQNENEKRAVENGFSTSNTIGFDSLQQQNQQSDFDLGR